MKSKRKVLIMVVVALICLTALAALTVWACRETYTIKTAADATAGDVAFLKLPTSASHIGYWRDGVNYLAEFQIPEQDFRQVFLLYRFQEITEVLEVRPKKFGDPQTFPPHAPATPVQVSSGLLYQERWSNGGGYRIVYDRASSRAYYSSSKR
jgi:hypothetical protein